MSRPPLANWALIAANVVVFGMQIACGVDLFVYGLVPAHVRWFQPLTMAFLHGGFFHLAGNMVFLWTFGNNVNDRLGHARYLGAYVGFAVLASLGHLVAESGSGIPCIGASGAVFGVMGMYVAFFPLNDVRMCYLLWVRPGTFSCSAIWPVAFWVGLNVYQAARGTGGNIAIWAHLGGFGVGFGSGLLLLARGWTERDDYDFLSWLARRRQRRLVERYAIGGRVMPHRGGPLPMPPAATAAPAAPPRVGSPRELRRTIQAHLANGEIQAVLDAYRQFTEIYPRLALEKDAQLEVANLLFRAGSYDVAAEAYGRFARFYPHHPRAADALYSAGVLHIHRLGRPEVGRRLLEEAMPLLSDPVKAERARHEIAAIGTPSPKRVPLAE